MRIEYFEVKMVPENAAYGQGKRLRITIEADGRVFDNTQHISLDWFENLNDNDFKSRFDHIFDKMKYEFKNLIDAYIEKEVAAPLSLKWLTR